jgi:hypothetical protein
MSDLMRTTPVTRPSTQSSDRSGESAPEQGLVWPPPDSDLDSYSLPPEPGQIPGQTPVSDSIAPRQTEARPSAEPESSREATPEWSPEDNTGPEVRSGGGQSDQGLVWLSFASEQVVTPPEHEVAATEPLVAPDTPTGNPLLLSDVLHSNVAFHWHEAVAIVRQLGDQLTHGLSLEPQGSIPGADGIELESTGRLRARLDPVGTVPAVRGFGYLLHLLLADTGAPVRLRLIVSQAVSEVPTFPSVERLMWELAGFERPRRLETLKQLYERAAAVRRTRLAPAAFGPDIHPASPPVSSRTVDQATEEAGERPIARPHLSWPAFTLALLAGAVCGALVFAAVNARSPGRGAAPTPQAVAELTTRDFKIESSTRDFRTELSTRDIKTESSMRDFTSGVPDASQKRTDAAPAEPVRPAAHGGASPSRARDIRQHDEAVLPAMKSATGPSEIAPPPIAEPVRLRLVGVPRSSLREVPQRAEREYRRARALFDQKDYAKAADGFQQVVKLLDDGELTGPVAELRSMAADFSVLSRATLSAMTGGHVYSSGDVGVIEPVALRLYLPDPAPETPPSHLGVLMIVVNGEGAVESVRLQSPGNRYHDRFLVSVAKTWRFRPALKDGLPVKFLKRIMITEPPPSDPQ